MENFQEKIAQDLIYHSLNLEKTGEIIGKFGKDFSKELAKGSLEFALMPLSIPTTLRKLKNKDIRLLSIVYDLDASVGNYLGIAGSAFTGGVGVIAEIGASVYGATYGNYWLAGLIAGTNVASFAYESYRSANKIFPNPKNPVLEDVAERE